eukprot:TRINITY_DN9919_c0_g1_i2.p1 TRINITY_DN9919_c0_g1~~TRINITY_DN9919_c0_g1_i2.p1  ORF type:complete len:267 (+),score=29.27 TRINITY_DN9919_c0_g1_i2:735-1535(+)
MQSFLQHGGGEHLDAATWHFYPMDGHTAKLSQFIDETTFTHFAARANTINAAVDKYSKPTNPNIKTWVGETSSAFGGGAPGISNSFADGFWWLDQLGTAAKNGESVMLRQDLIGGHYALFNKVGQSPNWSSVSPNPDFWSAALWTQLMSDSVYSATVEGKDNENIVAFAHATLGVPDATSLLLLNFNNETVDVTLENVKSFPRQEYHFTCVNTSKISRGPLASELKDRKMHLNNVLLALTDSGMEVPYFSPLKFFSPGTSYSHHFS